MPIATTADCDLELLAVDGTTWLPLMLSLEVDRNGTRAPKQIAEQLAGSTGGVQLTDWLEATVAEDWFPGVGIAYDAAPGCDTFSSPGYVLPGGAATDVALPAGPNQSNSPIVDMVEYKGDLWLAQQGSTTVGGRVMRSVGGTAAFADSLTRPVGQYVRGLCLGPDLSGATVLYAGIGNVDNGAGILAYWNGATWTETAPGAFGVWGRGRLATVWWEGDDGVGDLRLVATSSNAGHISYTRAGGWAMTPADWIEGVKTGSMEPGGDLVAARSHIWYAGRDGLYDLEETGRSPRLTGYDALHPGVGLAVAYLDAFVYRSAPGGVDRVQVGEGPVLQENPGLCSPGWMTRCESGWVTGWTTALLPWNGGMLNAVYSLQLSRAAIFWGKDRHVLGVETPNPMVWHGPFAINSVQETVSRMLIVAHGLGSETRLYVATWTTAQNAPPKLAYISLPSPGGAMADLKGNSGHRYADGAGTGVWQPFAQLHTLPDTVGDKASMKYIFQRTYGSLGLGVPSAATKLRVYGRADPAPSSVDWGTGTDIVTGPVATITPPQTAGHKHQQRIDFFSPNGPATPPYPAILDSIRSTFWRTAPDVDTWTFDCEYGDGVVSLQTASWANRGLSADAMTDQLLALARGDRTIMRDRQDLLWSVKIKHFLYRESIQHEGPYGKTVKARITLAILGPA